MYYYIVFLVKIDKKRVKKYTKSFEKVLYKLKVLLYTLITDLNLGENMINDFSRTLSLLRIERKLSQKNAAE